MLEIVVPDNTAELADLGVTSPAMDRNMSVWLPSCSTSKKSFVVDTPQPDRTPALRSLPSLSNTINRFTVLPPLATLMRLTRFLLHSIPGLLAHSL